MQTFAAEPPPDEAMNVKAPPGGWDRAASDARPPSRPHREAQAAVLLKRPEALAGAAAASMAANATAFTLAAAT